MVSPAVNGALFVGFEAFVNNSGFAAEVTSKTGEPKAGSSSITIS